MHAQNSTVEFNHTWAKLLAAGEKRGEHTARGTGEKNTSKLRWVNNQGEEASRKCHVSNKRKNEFWQKEEE